MSTDSRFVHKIWQEQELSKMVKGGVPFPMLSDAGGRIGALYGIYDEAAGVDIRGRFIIDPEFVVRAMEVLTPEVGRNPDELMRHPLRGTCQERVRPPVVVSCHSFLLSYLHLAIAGTSFASASVFHCARHPSGSRRAG